MFQCLGDDLLSNGLWNAIPAMTWLWGLLHQSLVAIRLVPFLPAAGRTSPYVQHCCFHRVAPPARRGFSLPHYAFAVFPAGCVAPCPSRSILSSHLLPSGCSFSSIPLRWESIS